MPDIVEMQDGENLDKALGRIPGMKTGKSNGSSENYSGTKVYHAAGLVGIGTAYVIAANLSARATLLLTSQLWKGLGSAASVAAALPGQLSSAARYAFNGVAGEKPKLDADVFDNIRIRLDGKISTPFNENEPIHRLMVSAVQNNVNRGWSDRLLAAQLNKIASHHSVKLIDNYNSDDAKELKSELRGFQTALVHTEGVTSPAEMQELNASQVEHGSSLATAASSLHDKTPENSQAYPAQSHEAARTEHLSEPRLPAPARISRDRSR
jgi:hypothetical protein